MKAIIVNKLSLFTGRKLQVRNHDITKPLESYSSIIFDQKEGLEIAIGEKFRKKEQKLHIKGSCTIIVDYSPWCKKIIRLQIALAPIFFILLSLGGTTSSNIYTISIFAVIVLFFILSFIVISTPLTIKTEEF